MRYFRGVDEDQLEENFRDEEGMMDLRTKRKVN
jgi:hypothetical protein